MIKFLAGDLWQAEEFSVAGVLEKLLLISLQCFCFFWGDFKHINCFSPIAVAIRVSTYSEKITFIINGEL